MKTLSFRGAILNRFDCRQGKEGGDTYVRIYIDADLSKPVRDEMGWGEPSEGCLSGKLGGALLGRNMLLVPGDKVLADYEIQLPISDARDFQFSTTTNDDGVIVERTLHFVVKTSAPDAENWCRRYMQNIGRHKSLLKLTFEREVQSVLALGEADAVEVKDAIQ